MAYNSAPPGGGLGLNLLDFNDTSMLVVESRQESRHDFAPCYCAAELGSCQLRVKTNARTSGLTVTSANAI
jgi:hypothetical protein